MAVEMVTIFNGVLRLCMLLVSLPSKHSNLSKEPGLFRIR